MEANGSLIQAIILGIVQGATEFLPVSSSGHLVLVRHMMDLPEVSLLFDVMLHVATLLVVCIHYRKLIGTLLQSLLRFTMGKADESDAGNLRFIVAVVLATVVTVALALIFRAAEVDEYGVRGVALAMLATALLLATTGFAKGTKSLGVIGWKTAILVGFGQGLGTLAGISRSGATLSASLWGGLDRKAAGSFAFILAIPAIAGALVLSLATEASGGTASLFTGFETVVAAVAAFATGLVAIKVLLWMVEKAKLWYFSLYLGIVAIITLVMVR